MEKWIFLSLFLIIALGFLIHSDLEIPKVLGWMGKLPGDLVIKKKGIVLYFPITTSLIFSSALSFLSSLYRE